MQNHLSISHKLSHGKHPLNGKALSLHFHSLLNEMWTLRSQAPTCCKLGNNDKMVPLLKYPSKCKLNISLKA